MFDEVLLDVQAPSQDILQSLLKVAAEKISIQNGYSPEPIIGRYYIDDSATELIIERTCIHETPFVFTIKEWVGEHQGIVKTEYYMFQDAIGSL